MGAQAQAAQVVYRSSGGDASMADLISGKGSVMVFDRDTLAYWERASRSASVWKAGQPCGFRSPGDTPRPFVLVPRLICG